MEDDGREEWLRDHQDGRVYPLGRALRHSYDAENHDTLGSDVTGLMIDLSRVPYRSAALPPAAMPPADATLPGESRMRPSIMARISGLFGRCQD